jgi:hypothetical protein
MRAGRERRVPDDGLGVGVRVMGIAIDDAVLPQVTKAAVPEPIVITRGQVAAQLVDRDLQDQFRGILGMCGSKDCQEYCWKESHNLVSRG